ncbi:MAG: hypothetical protein PVJ01_02735 [Pseudomonadota bacterium]|jgi:uncharacterized membrane protein YraQ (UPF0718 family)
MNGEDRFHTEYFFAGIFGCFILLSYLLDWSAGQKMGLNFYEFSLKMIVLVPVIFIYIGILDVWVPKEVIQKHIGEESGIKGVFYVVLLAFFQGGPLYVAFPLAHLLWKKGCSMRNIFVYIGTFSALKVPMFMFETSFLGWKFALLRAAVSLPVFLLVAEVMAKSVRSRELPLTKM